MTAEYKRTQDGAIQRAAPQIQARMVVGAASAHGVAANDNPMPLSLRLRRLWVLLGAVAAFGTLTAIVFG